MKPFVHLHLHTEYSLLDGATKIDDLFDIALANNMPAVAITDHGNMYGIYKFYEKALAKGVKPIIGCEFYMCDDISVRAGRPDYDHIVLLAKDDVGFHNIIKLCSMSFVDGMYYKPRIDLSLLRAYSEGIICLSGCLGGRIQHYLLNDRYDDAVAFALQLRGLFAEGDFYIELQYHNMLEQSKILPQQVRLAEQIGVKCVATNDVHYLTREHARMQDILLCVNMQKTIDDDRMRMPSDEFFMKNYDQMAASLPDYLDALDTTLEIADKCNVIIRSKSHGDVTRDTRYILPNGENFIPKYVNDENIDNFIYLKKLCYQGLTTRYGDAPPAEYYSRADFELDLIQKLGFVEYFLIVWDYIHYAESIGIPVGVGRGSGAGSIVAYSVGITKIDPMRYDLLFERFINPERVSMPDFDIDFCVDRRGEVIEYVRNKYGADHVSLIITFGTMAAKNAIRDVSRVMRMPYAEADKITKLIPNKLPDGIKRPPVLKYYFGKTGNMEDNKFIIPELRQLYEGDETIAEVVNMAIQLEGMPRNCSTHAAGVLICPNPVSDHIAVSKVGSDVASQCNMNELEHLGLLKMDFLGLRTLTDIHKAGQYALANHGAIIDFDQLGYDDAAVYRMIGSGDLDAVFQLESAGMKKFMKSLKPTCLEDIIAGVALYRPGPMDSIPKYIDNKHNPDNITYAHAILEPILNVTYGCIVYQEQVMRIVQDMAGYTLAQADNIRRLMSKKKKIEMEREREYFVHGKKDDLGITLIPGAKSKGVPEAVAYAIFAEMESFASYAFNKSHAAAYAYISYQTAYLKCYYHSEFITAVLNNRITNIDEIKRYTVVAREHGINMLPPDINRSLAYFSTDGESIRFGLAGLKNVGLTVIEDIIAERDSGGVFVDILDFVSRVSPQALNKRCMESLILTGAFDSFGRTRSQLMSVYTVAIERVASVRKSSMSGQYNMFDTLLADQQSVIGLNYPLINEYVPDVLLSYEKEMSGAYLSGHPLDAYADRVRTFTLTSNMLKPDEVEDENDESVTYSSISHGQSVICGGCLEDVKTLITRSGKRMAFATIEDLYGTIELAFFSNSYDKHRDMLSKNALMTIRGKVSIRDGMPPSINVDSVELWDRATDAQPTTSIPTQPAPQARRLGLVYDHSDISLHDSVKTILSEYPGADAVYLKDPATADKYLLGITVQIRESLLFELRSLLPADSVRVF